MMAPDWRPNWHKLKNGYFYVNINKNASTSIKAHRIDHKRRVPTGKDLSFAVIRHPCDRLVSCFENRGADFGNIPWDRFIDHVCSTDDEHINSHARSQYVNLTPKPSMLVNFDHINEFFAETGINLEKHNFSKRKPWEEYFSESDIARVKERYREDFDLWRQLETTSLVTNYEVEPFQRGVKKITQEYSVTNPYNAAPGCMTLKPGDSYPREAGK